MDECEGSDDWNTEQLLKFINPSDSITLNEISEKRRTILNTRKAILSACGTQIANRERYNPHMILGDSSDEDNNSGDEDNSGEVENNWNSLWIHKPYHVWFASWI